MTLLKAEQNHKGRSHTALLIIDVINDLQFDGGEKVLPWATRLVPRLKKFRSHARKVQIPVIYTNDNFGIWHGSFDQIIKHCTKSDVSGKFVSNALKPSRTDYVILKPGHSAFFHTPLIPLLAHLQVKHLILTGIATNLCVLFTAHDAHMNKFKLTVLSDCCAAENDSVHNDALTHLKRYCRARIIKSNEFWN